MTIDKKKLNIELEILQKCKITKDEVTHRATKLAQNCKECRLLSKEKEDIVFCDTHLAIQCYLIGRRKQKEHNNRYVVHKLSSSSLDENGNMKFECSKFHTGYRKFSESWKDVTCKLCLEKKKK